MKRISIFLTGACMSLSLAAGQPAQSELKFRKDGKFKIVQFTDLHFSVGVARSDSTLILMKEVIELEHPDLIMLTGDVVTPVDPRRGWLTLTQVLVDARIPWAVLFGNHDPENYMEINKKQILETIARQPYNLTANGPDHLSGNANYVMKVQASTSGKTAAALYCLDSHGGRGASMYLERGIPVPDQSDWIKGDQVEWYRQQSRNLTRQNHGQPLPALAFFHIPLPEYREVVGKPTTVGVREETICAQSINPGLFLALYECGDVMGTFTGHDHDNNYIGCLKNICLAYGQVSGRQCYGKIGRGARVIELYEGERKFDTWILKLYDCDDREGTWTPTNDTERKLFVTYPDSFVEEK